MISGTWVGGLLYHKRQPNKAPVADVARLGAVMAFLCIIEGAVVLSFWKFAAYPEVVTLVAAIANFVFPFVLMGAIRKSLQRAKMG